MNSLVSTFSILKPGFLFDILECCIFVFGDPRSELELLGDAEGLAKPQIADIFVVLMASSTNMLQSHVYATYLLS